MSAAITQKTKLKCEGCEKDFTLSECEVVIVDVDPGGRDFRHWHYAKWKYNPKPEIPMLEGYVVVELEALCPDCDATLARAKVETEYSTHEVTAWEESE